LVYTTNVSEVILSAITNAAILEVFLLQQCNVVNGVCLNVELYASQNAQSANNPGKRMIRFPHLTQS